MTLAEMDGGPSKSGSKHQVRAMKPSRWPLAAVAVLLVCMTEAPAFAYIDPTVPGLVMQILAPIIIAVSVMWRRIRGAFSRALDFVLRRNRSDENSQ